MNAAAANAAAANAAAENTNAPTRANASTNPPPNAPPNAPSNAATRANAPSNAPSNGNVGNVGNAGHVGNAGEDAVAAIREALEGSDGTLIEDAIAMFVRPAKIPGRISDALHASKMLNGEEDTDDNGGFVRFLLTILKPLMRIILWLRSSLFKPILIVIPEWAILLYLVGRNVGVAIMAVRVKQSSAAGSVGRALNDDWAFVNMYSASAVVFGVLSIVLFALLAGRSVSTSVIAVVLSCAGVAASALMNHLLQAADTASFKAAEATPAATERRLLFVHGGAGLAFAAVTMSIPMCCPY